MKTSDVDIVIVPGLGGGTEKHWYARWQRKLPTARRVVQADWDVPTLADWTGRLVEAVETASRPVVVVAHSLGTIVVAHAADRVAERVVGGFLVAAPAASVLGGMEQIDPAFTVPRATSLPFPAVLVASRDDPYSSWEEAESLAKAWGATLVDGGASGHLDDESGHGPWPEGLMRFAGFLKALS